MFRSARNRLRPVWITFVWNCLPCFSNTNIGSVTSSFDIVQFSRSCAPQPYRLTAYLFYHFRDKMSSTFLRSFWTFLNLERFRFLGISRNFSASIGSFQGLPAELSEVILLSQRLALKYNTTHPDDCQHFLTSFFQILCGGGLGAKLQPKWTLSGIAARLRGFSLILLHYIGRANPNRV